MAACLLRRGAHYGKGQGEEFALSYGNGHGEEFASKRERLRPIRGHGQRPVVRSKFLVPVGGRRAKALEKTG